MKHELEMTEYLIKNIRKDEKTIYELV